MKKALVLTLAAALLMCMFAVAVSAVEPHEIKWSFEEGVLEPFTTEDDWGSVKLIQDRDTDRNDGVTPMDKDGTYFLCTVFFEGGEDYDESPMGSIKSPNFYIYDPSVTLLIAGGAPQNYVAVCRASDGEELGMTFNPLLSGHPLQEVEIDLGDNYVEGEEVYVKIVDGLTGGWGFITVDNIVAKGILVSEAEAAVEETAAPETEAPAPETEAPETEAPATEAPVTTAPQTADVLFTVLAALAASGIAVVSTKKK